MWTQKNSAETLQTIYNNKLNEKNCISAHPKDIYMDIIINGTTNLLQSIKISNNEYDYCWNIMSEQEWKLKSKEWTQKHTPENRNYKHKQKSSKYAKGEPYNALQRMRQNKQKMSKTKEKKNSKKKTAKKKTVKKREKIRKVKQIN